MDSTELFLKLVKEFAKDGKISAVEKTILEKKALELGIDPSSLETFIEMELGGALNTLSPSEDSLPTNSLDTRQEIQKSQEGGRINKLQIIELFINEMARDGKIDEQEKEVILKKGSELNIAPELLNDMINKELKKNKKIIKTYYSKWGTILHSQEGFENELLISYFNIHGGKTYGRYEINDKGLKFSWVDEDEKIIKIIGYCDAAKEENKYPFGEFITKIDFIEYTDEGVLNITTNDVIIQLKFNNGYSMNWSDYYKEEEMLILKKFFGEEAVK